MENSNAVLAIASAVLTILTTFGTAAMKYLVGQIAQRDLLIAKHNEQTTKSNEALIEAGKANAEIAALVPGLLKENYEWMQRFDSLLVKKAEK
jgi:hypothetical protein